MMMTHLLPSGAGRAAVNYIAAPSVIGAIAVARVSGERKGLLMLGLQRKLRFIFFRELVFVVLILQVRRYLDKLNEDNRIDQQIRRDDVEFKIANEIVGPDRLLI